MKVYFARMGRDGPIKIGISSDPEKRTRSLSRQAPDLVETIAVLDAGRELELRLHRALHASRRRFEWFNATPEVKGVAVLARDYGLEAVEMWLTAKETQFVEIRPLDFTPTKDAEADCRVLLKVGVRNSVGRFGKPTVAAAMGRGVDRLEAAMLRGYDVPVTAVYGMMQLDPGAFVPVLARTGDVPAWIKERSTAQSQDAIDSLLQRLTVRAA